MEQFHVQSSRTKVCGLRENYLGTLARPRVQHVQSLQKQVSKLLVLPESHGCSALQMRVITIPGLQPPASYTAPKASYTASTSRMCLGAIFDVLSSTERKMNVHSALTCRKFKDKFAAAKSLAWTFSYGVIRFSDYLLLTGLKFMMFEHAAAYPTTGMSSKPCSRLRASPSRLPQGALTNLRLSPRIRWHTVVE